MQCWCLRWCVFHLLLGNWTPYSLTLCSHGHCQDLCAQTFRYQATSDFPNGIHQSCHFFREILCRPVLDCTYHLESTCHRPVQEPTHNAPTCLPSRYRRNSHRRIPSRPAFSTVLLRGDASPMKSAELLPVQIYQTLHLGTSVLDNHPPYAVQQWYHADSNFCPIGNNDPAHHHTVLSAVPG